MPPQQSSTSIRRFARSISYTPYTTTGVIRSTPSVHQHHASPYSRVTEGVEGAKLIQLLELYHEFLSARHSSDAMRSLADGFFQSSSPSTQMEEEHHLSMAPTYGSSMQSSSAGNVWPQANQPLIKLELNEDRAHDVQQHERRDEDRGSQGAGASPSKASSAMNNTIWIVKPPGEPGRPNCGGYSIKKATGWNDRTYNKIRRWIIKEANKMLNVLIPYEGQDEEKLEALGVKALQKFPCLGIFVDLWPVGAIVLTHIRNVRNAVAQ